MVSRQVDQKIGEKIAQILEKVAQRVAKPKKSHDHLHYTLINAININNKSYFHPKLFCPFKK
jgi:hypothetical protein